MYEIVPSELKVLHPRPGTTVVEVLGEHDLGTSDETARLLAREPLQKHVGRRGHEELEAFHLLAVFVDVTETQFIDSSFLKTLKNAQQSAKELGHTVLMQVNTEPIVRRVLELTNFFDHFDYVSTREEALAWAPEDRVAYGAA